jgi:RND family efflux transporter MFP subunit
MTFGLGADARAQMPPVPVVVAQAVERTVASSQRFVGTLQPVRTATVGSAVDGRVVEYPINEGDPVTKGQPLCKLLTQTVELELAAARAELELRKQELAELVNGSLPEVIDQAEARVASTEALMKYRRARLERTQTLFEQRTISDEEMDEAVSAAQQAEQEHLAAKAVLALAIRGPRAERIAQARARALTQEEEIRRIEDRLAKFTIVAPFDGYVVAEHTEIGHWVKQGDPVAEVIELDYVDVEVTVLENYIPFVRVGAEVNVEIGALGTEPFDGQVALIIPRADLRSRSFPVKVRVENRDNDGTPLLKAGMFAQVILPVGNPEIGVLVPKDALVHGGMTPVVYVVDLDGPGSQQGTVRPVSVRIGVAAAELIQIKGDVAAGQTVVVQGNERLRPGQQVVVSAAAAAANEDERSAVSGRQE